MRFLSFIAVALFLSAPSVFAQVTSNSFGIQVAGPNDTEAPSTPTLLSADSVASTQIDLAWSAATDNAVVSGYVVIRDGTPIATTTLLSYADAGLVASSTYAYVVKAFDGSNNYSSSSNSLAATTLAPPETESGDNTEGTAARIVIDELRVVTGVSTTSLFLTTARPARFEVRFGRSASYELGYIVKDTYSVEHAFLLTDLEPGTRYEYEIIGYTQQGLQSVVQNGVFTTEQVQFASLPANVIRFEAVASGDDVALSWQLPESEYFSHVRIVRSHLGFPEHPQDGAIVYQGTGITAVDTSVLQQYSPVYYTAFVYDRLGNISSGAVTLVYAPPAVGSTEEVVQTPIITPEATSSIDVDRVTIDMKMPKLSDIIISQAGRTSSLLDPSVQLNSEQEFTISLPYSAVAGNLKSIIVSILDPTDNRKAHSFLLRINRDQTAYEATIAALQIEGKSQITLEIYDYEAFVVATYRVPLTFISSSTSKTDLSVFPDTLYKYPVLTLALGSFSILILIFLFMLYATKKLPKGEDNG